MNKVTFPIRLFLDALRDTIKVINHFELTKINNKLIYFRLFFIKLFFSNQWIRNLIKTKKVELGHLKENKIFNNSTSEILESLDVKGYSDLLNLNDTKLGELKTLVYESEDYDKKKINLKNFDLKKKYSENELQYFDRLSSVGISRLTGTINLNNDNSLREMILSKNVLEIAASYLNCRDISINATFFISNPMTISEKEKYLNAQYFHWDNDFSKFLKLYIYLTDVEDGCGPHIYIPFTHRKKKPEHKLCRLYSDENIFNSYDKKKIFYGKAGSCFFVDGYGLHKGETPYLKPRLMINIHFGRGKILYSKNDKYIKI